MLVTSATKRVVDYVHGDATYTGPVRRGIPHLVILVAGFHERLFNPSPACNDTDRRPALGIEPFCFATGHPDTDAILCLIDNDCLNARRADELAAIVGAGFNVADV
jgi:hypothetical protein